ncbi:AAA family ATPase [Clostridium sp. HMP27]|uniref:AAA family ATPase n=1 Tax=Clostridium sp. HMP27 TaxID=1487921 RepID=UPI00052C296B|nr:AAA family ATPase [Clostridium sp. HMP27]KGK85440.1 hypothetical protein DP68_16175 [Clostridium sp. HMP27]
MSKLLYIYDGENLAALKEDLVGYDFITLTSIVRECDTASNICRLSISNHAIDLTNFFYDTSNNRWHRGVIEEYIEEINDQFPNVVFTLFFNEEEKFTRMYPFLFSEDDIHYFVTKKESDQAPDDIIYINSITNDIFVYKDVSEICEKSNTMNIFSFSQLVKDFNGISANFNFDKLEKNTAYLIDITSLIEYLKFRKDQTFIYELIFFELSKRENIKYLVHKSLTDTMHELFPFIFRIQKDFKSQVVDECTDLENIEKDERIIDEVNNIASSLSQQLQGHENFKRAFKANLLKFKLLNRIGRRKIMSIFICGKSGIGKTEFARLLSEIMYPGEAQIKLNFGNYSTEGVLNSLIGSPLGYVGSEKGGELINKVKESESKVILIDEFEKADGKVFNFFYELLEDGQFTDRAGNVHNLNEYIIVFTSNLNMKNYNQYIPEPLDSRFDMKYSFTPLDDEDKLRFIQVYSERLIYDIKNEFDVSFDKDKLDIKLQDLIECDNLREIKRSIEDVVIEELKLNFI